MIHAHSAGAGPSSFSNHDSGAKEDDGMEVGNMVKTSSLTNAKRGPTPGSRATHERDFRTTNHETKDPGLEDSTGPS